MPRFYVFVNGEKTAEILTEFSFLKPRYHIFGKNWTVEGDFLAHDYTIMEQGNEIASVHKVWMSWGDSFELNIYRRSDCGYKQHIYVRATFKMMTGTKMH